MHSILTWRLLGHRSLWLTKPRLVSQLSKWSSHYFHQNHKKMKRYSIQWFMILIVLFLQFISSNASSFQSPTFLIRSWDIKEPRICVHPFKRSTAKLSSLIHQWSMKELPPKKNKKQKKLGPASHLKPALKMPSPFGPAFICLWSGMWVCGRIPAWRQMWAWKRRLIPPQRQAGPLMGFWIYKQSSRTPPGPTFQRQISMFATWSLGNFWQLF